MIAIIDYDMGNIGSIINMLKKVGANNVVITHDVATILQADRLILPGVGAFDTGMSMLQKYELIDCLKTCVIQNKKPILGICLGMQLLGKSSQEGVLPGLGYVDFENIKLDVKDYGLRVPHMGWDYVNVLKPQSQLVKNIQLEPRYYFVHSYYAKCKVNTDILMTCHYGIDITAAIQHDNIYGVQFHPEKSHKYGALIIKNFLEVCL